VITALDSDVLERFRRVVVRRLGLQFDDAKLTFLSEVLRRRVTASAQNDETYLTRLETGVSTGEVGALAQELTVGETYFFRNIDQFHAFAQVALPERMRVQNTSRCLRFLSAGCASGEEAYSLAILVGESLVDSSWNVSIRAVDVNPAVLRRAAGARFTKWALRETPPEIECRWFRHDGSDLVLAEAARAAVKFDERNLVTEDSELWRPGTYDVIFCRNVLMYLTPEQAQSLVTRITRALAPGGYLFLGHAETLRGLSQRFHLCHTHGTFYYQHREEAGDDRPQHGSVAVAPPASAPAPATIVEGADTWVDAIRQAAERIEVLTRTPAPVTTATASAPCSDLRLAVDLLRRERFTEALDLMDQHPLEWKRDPDALLLQALLLAHSGRLAVAEQVCQQLLAIDELNAGAYYVLALCREGSGDRRGAVDHDQVAGYLDPLFAMPRFHLGLLARRAGDRSAAQRELAQALLLFQREDASRLLFFGGGFTREALIALCRAELEACGGHT